MWIHKDNDLVDLTITYSTHAKGTKPSSEVIHTNKKHPFLTVEKGFLPVGQITLGMHVVEANGQVGVISGWKMVPGVKTMYNLEVAQDHTFVVGLGMWVVHNCSDPSQLEMTKTVINNDKVVAKTVDPNAAMVGMDTARTSRPYVQGPATPWLVKNIMEGGEPQADKWLANGQRWHVPGFMNGREGMWELAIDHDTNRIVHFLFNSR